MRRQDPRDYQILFLSLFLVLGIGIRDPTLRPRLIIVALATCILTQWVTISLTRLKYKNSSPSSSLFHLPASSVNAPKISSLKSAIITGLSLSLLLRVDQYTTMVIAGSLAILSKFLLKVGDKHFFNPANFGIVSVLMLRDDAWVSPGQWGDSGWYALLFAGTGAMVLKRVGRWDTTAAFLGIYAFLEAMRNLWLGWTWDVFCHRLMSGSLLLFALFMLTDPRSIPNARKGRLIWAGFIAVLTFILRNQFFVTTAVFWALFALAPLTLILDFIWLSPRFSWSEESDQHTVKSVESVSIEAN
ncbi:MAG: Na+-transporting NADH:ubiquinone oxidoreductase, subunit NqrB [Symploca sp. SIO3C6]|uniref:Na+-transporting NADH:ubiquinone oxidoreductase, subunit NqrB n=1 Tax=Symploca sp. SIO1C4 TaxID=2607765 RepID=A0A6B3NBQ6_9CYAN|nr:Na+-transporting NADH:ubiquinone oxidoreductase, subunit NqrB [Symploca sp. SIO3C6]NER30986.1 Na+-transporting NADH:ubiquinone oxidoreductase, subunit NqrB [Symploca sp. SIO1C4]